MEERVASLILHQVRQYHELIVKVQKKTTGRIECDVPYQSGKLLAFEILDIWRLQKELKREKTDGGKIGNKSEGSL